MAEMSGAEGAGGAGGAGEGEDAGHAEDTGPAEDTGHAGGAAGAGAAAGSGAAAGPGGVAGSGGVAGAGGVVGPGGAAGVAGPDCPEGIRRALAAHTTMTLAYVDEDGPQACAVLYATGVAEGAATAGAAKAPGAIDEADEVGVTGVPGVSGVADDVEAGAATGPEAGAVPALYFVTATTTRHGRALAEPGTRVAFTAQRDGQEWSGLTGLQGRGRCRPLTGAERAAGWQVYVERFPFVAASDRLRAALERTTLWELRPDWLRLIDNGQGFGHKEEWSRG
ncbi:hypothetical protein ACFYXD_10065 [Streptomyces platensis]|uniref:hypothetical protein n=1 Tax=Streptomyces platensis TaxID=58346 RepID=UPI0036A8979D